MADASNGEGAAAARDQPGTTTDDGLSMTEQHADTQIKMEESEDKEMRNSGHTDISGDHDVQIFETADADLPPLPEEHDSDLSFVDPTTTVSLASPSHLDSEDSSALMEKEMRRNFANVESSFLPEQEYQHAGNERPAGADDTYLFGGSPGNIKKAAATQARQGKHEKGKKSIADLIRDSVARGRIKEEEEARSAPTSPEAKKDEDRTVDMSSSEVEDEEPQSRESTTSFAPSSPAADAAKRNESRSQAGHANSKPNANEDSISANEQSVIKHGHVRQESQASTIKGEESSDLNNSELSQRDSVASPRSDGDPAPLQSETASSRLLKRPSFLSRRQSSQRSSASSFTNGSILSDSSDQTIGADFALQSGGAVPNSRSLNPELNMARLPSFGNLSVSSAGGSVNGDSTDYPRAATGELSRLDEEPLTPRPGTSGKSAPTDTVLAQHIRNIRVPETVAKEYREKYGARSPNRLENGPLSSLRDSRKGNLTLKEQNSKIDKLTKENFDLKLKIHFLNQALQSRSDEGVKEMIGKNVQLQTDLANEKKENQSMRKKMRELEQKLKDQEAARSKPQPRPGSAHSDRSEELADMQEEVIFLRETMQEHEVEFERLREEAAREMAEKRKLAEYIKVMTDERSRTTEDVAVEETIDMWKDLLQAETARREQADEDAESTLR